MSASRRRRTQEVTHEIERMAERLALPRRATVRAEEICDNVSATPLGIRLPHNVLAAAALYVGCREGRTPVTLRDLAAADDSNQREVGRCYLSLLRELNISRPRLNGKRYLYHLTLSKRVSQDAFNLSQEIIKEASARGLGGRNPMTLAAAALYLACCSLGEKVTQAELAQAAEVGEPTVRDCCKAIRMLGAVPVRRAGQLPAS